MNFLHIFLSYFQDWLTDTSEYWCRKVCGWEFYIIARILKKLDFYKFRPIPPKILDHYICYIFLE